MTLAILRAALIALLFALASCGSETAASQTVVGAWVLRAIDGEPVGEVTIRVEFKPDGTFEVVGPCHRSVGQYYLTERGATLQLTELKEEKDCSRTGREVTRRMRAAVQNSSRAGLAVGALQFFDRKGVARIRLERDSAPTGSSGGK